MRRNMNCSPSCLSWKDWAYLLRKSLRGHSSQSTTTGRYRDSHLSANSQCCRSRSDNYSSAIKRLIKALVLEDTKQYEDEDIIEKANRRNAQLSRSVLHAHSGVWREHKPRPLRIVFDASFKRKGQLSLNDVTLKGESMVNKIHDNL
ncbi:hypothetical protein COOONC_01077 [Cooperia oncophora]